MRTLQSQRCVDGWLVLWMTIRRFLGGCCLCEQHLAWGDDGRNGTDGALRCRWIPLGCTCVHIHHTLPHTSALEAHLTL